MAVITIIIAKSLLSADDLFYTEIEVCNISHDIKTPSSLHLEGFSLL